MSEKLKAGLNQDDIDDLDNGAIEGDTLEEGEETMDIWEHINELRSRLLKSMLALLATTMLSFAFTQQIIAFLAKPIGGIEKLVSIEMTENMGVFMRVSLLSGLIFAIPFIVYQILAFIVPGLKQSERKWIYLAIPIASVLSGGCGFCQFCDAAHSHPVFGQFFGHTYHTALVQLHQFCHQHAVLDRSGF